MTLIIAPEKCNLIQFHSSSPVFVLPESKVLTSTSCCPSLLHTYFYHHPFARACALINRLGLLCRLTKAMTQLLLIFPESD